MTDKGAQTIDLGDVKIDDLFGDKLSPRSPGVENQNAMAKDIELFEENKFEPIVPVRDLSPQRPMDYGNSAGSTDPGLPPNSSMSAPESDFMANAGLKERLQDLRVPIIVGALVIVGGILLGPYLLELWDSSNQPTVTAARFDVDEFPLTLSDPPAAPKAEVPDTRRGELSPINRELIGNPYWALPNRLQAEGQAGVRISPQQEARWRFGLSHQYPYQRYVTTRDIRRSRIRSAAFLLFEALEQPKFWTRMHALFGLAEMGLEIDVGTVEKGLGDARSSLVANYFKRFIERRPSGGELYVMRQAIRVVDARARLVILQALSRLEGDMNQLYLIGADLDPSPSVQNWLNQERRYLNISAVNRDRYETLLSDYVRGGGASADSLQVVELQVEELQESSILNEVQFFQELIDHEDESIVTPDEFDGFETIR